MTQNSIWWVETADLDGIRQDTYPYSDVKAMAEWCNRVKEEYPYFNIVGECWISEAAKLAVWQKGYGKANGMDDSIIPFSQGQELFGLAPEPKQFVAVEGAHHNDLIAVLGLGEYRKLLKGL